MNKPPRSLCKARTTAPCSSVSPPRLPEVERLPHSRELQPPGQTRLPPDTKPAPFSVPVPRLLGGGWRELGWSAHPGVAEFVPPQKGAPRPRGAGVGMEHRGWAVHEFAQSFCERPSRWTSLTEVAVVYSLCNPLCYVATAGLPSASVMDSCFYGRQTRCRQ